jgi:hypothetical protein
MLVRWGRKVSKVRLAQLDQKARLALLGRPDRKVPKEFQERARFLRI